MSKLKEIVIGGGCFWCVEALLKELKGVEKLESGYSGGNAPGIPTYREVCSGLTGHAEVVKVSYDETLITLHDLLVVFMTSHDPTTLNRQGGDVGTQYRSVIFYKSEEEKQSAKSVINELKSYYQDPIVTEVSPLINYFEAEDYHQNYYEQNKSQSYCAAVITPKLTKLRKLYADKLK